MIIYGDLSFQIRIWNKSKPGSSKDSSWQILHGAMGTIQCFTLVQSAASVEEISQQKLLPTSLESRANQFGELVAASSLGRIAIGAKLYDYQGQDSGATYVYRLLNGVEKAQSDGGRDK